MVSAHKVLKADLGDICQHLITQHDDKSCDGDTYQLLWDPVSVGSSQERLNSGGDMCIEP